MFISTKMLIAENIKRTEQLHFLPILLLGVIESRWKTQGFRVVLP